MEMSYNWHGLPGKCQEKGWALSWLSLREAGIIAGDGARKDRSWERWFVVTGHARGGVAAVPLRAPAAGGFGAVWAAGAAWRGGG